MGGLLCLFEIGKKYPKFGKKCRVCVHLCVKFSTEMQFQEYLGDKTRKFLPAEPSFVCRT